MASASRPSSVGGPASNARRAALIGLVAGSVLLTACGSRRPLSDFLATNQAVGNNNQSGASAGPGGTVNPDQPGATGAPAPGETTGTGQQPGSGPTAGATGGPGGGGGVQPSGGTGGVANFASDVGVTATSINLGNVSTKSGGFGEDQFTPFYYGAAAYFDALNAAGGINGRKVTFNFCDDGGNDSGDSDCVRKFVDQSKVFSFVANTCLSCGGLQYANDKGVPMVGGVAIDFKDYALSHDYRYTGNPYPQNGHIGWKGKIYLPTMEYQFFKDKYNVQKAGVVYYDNSAASKSQGLAIAAALRAVGVQVTEYAENVALPNYDSAVVDMKSRGITGVWDSIDIGGNQNLCKSIDSNGLKLTAKVSTISVWSQEVATQFPAPCRNYIYSVEDPGALSYDQTDNPEIAKYRAAMRTYFPDRESKMFQWSVDGWASAMWFTDAAASCGAALTRVCLEKYLSNPAGYSAHGLWSLPTHSMKKINFDTQKTEYRCIQVVHWDDTAKSFKSVQPMSQSCYTAGYVTTPAPA